MVQIFSEEVDGKIIAIIVLFIIFISGFAAAAFFYGEKRTYETDDGREDRRASEDEQIEYELAVNIFYFFLIVGIVGFIIFFELSRYHWIEIGKKLARFEYMNEMDVKKRAIEEVRIQTIIREEEEEQEKTRESAKEKVMSKMKMPKIKKVKKKKKTKKTDTTTVPITKPNDLSLFQKPTEDQLSKADEISKQSDVEEKEVSEEPISQPPLEEKPELPTSMEAEGQYDDGMDNDAEEEDEETDVPDEEDDDNQENNNVTQEDENQSSPLESPSPNKEEEEDTDDDSELCPNCFADGKHLGFGQFKCPDCETEWQS